MYVGRRAKVACSRHLLFSLNIQQDFLVKFLFVYCQVLYLISQEFQGLYLLLTRAAKKHPNSLSFFPENQFDRQAFEAIENSAELLSSHRAASLSQSEGCGPALLLGSQFLSCPPLNLGASYSSRLGSFDLRSGNKGFGATSPRYSEVRAPTGINVLQPIFHAQECFFLL